MIPAGRMNERTARNHQDEETAMTNKATTKQTQKAAETKAAKTAETKAETKAAKVAETKAADAAEQIGAETRKTVEEGTEQVRKSVEEGTQQVRQSVEESTEKVRQGVEQGTEQVRKGLETTAAFNKGNLEAVVASSQVAAKTLESVTSELAAFSKKSYEDSMAAAKELSSCRSVAELVEKQTEFSRTSIESFVTEANKLNEMYATAAKEAFEPFGKRFTAAADMMKGNRA